ncbi:MAG: TVP38/TMEM64 family protein [Thermomicrobiales bacterium]
MTRRYTLVALAIAAFVLVSFLIVEALGIPILVDPSAELGRGGIGAAMLGVGLLLVDVLLPVPSSIVMTAQGALFGVALGTALSMIGSVGAALVGFAIGRKGSRLVARFVSPEEQQASTRLLERWGALALIVTRPVPILAETTAIMAGTSTLGWGRATLGIVVGAFPAALIYAIAGAYATSVASGVLVFVLVIVLAGIFWAIGWFVEQRFLMPRRVRQESDKVQDFTERDSA